MCQEWPNCHPGQRVSEPTSTGRWRKRLRRLEPDWSLTERWVCPPAGGHRHCQCSGQLVHPCGMSSPSRGSGATTTTPATRSPRGTVRAGTSLSHGSVLLRFLQVRLPPQTLVDSCTCPDWGSNHNHGVSGWQATELPNQG